MRNAGGNLKICKSDQTYSQVGYRTLVEVFRLLQIVRLPPEFLRSPRAAFGGCSPHAPEGAVSRPPSGATLPPGEGIAAFGVPDTPGGVALWENPLRNPVFGLFIKN